MKQYVIINNKLKMDKGKVARVCLTAGNKTRRLIGKINLLKWYFYGSPAVVLRTDDIQEIERFVEYNNIKYSKHVDAGHTQVRNGDLCMITFFHVGNDFLDSLRLY